MQMQTNGKEYPRIQASVLRIRMGFAQDYLVEDTEAPDSSDFKWDPPVPGSVDSAATLLAACDWATSSEETQRHLGGLRIQWMDFI